MESNTIIKMKPSIDDTSSHDYNIIGNAIYETNPNDDFPIKLTIINCSVNQIKYMNGGNNKTC